MNARTLRALAPLVAVAVVLVVPLLVTDRFLLKVFTFAGVNALVVVGLALLFGYAGWSAWGTPPSWASAPTPARSARWSSAGRGC